MAKRKSKSPSGKPSPETSIALESPDIALSHLGETVVGHKELLCELYDLVRKKRFPQSLMLVGKPGLGKSLIARRCAAQLLCNAGPPPAGTPDNIRVAIQEIRGCGACSACSQVMNACHPDLHWIDVRTEAGDTEHIRDLICSLTLAPFDGIARVVVLDHAEQLHIAAANALLKSIEEPREGTYFILIVSSLLSVPVTIRSRCQIFNCAPLSLTQVETLLTRFAPTQAPEERRRIAEISDGAFGTALSLLEYHEDYRSALIDIYGGDIDRAAQLAKQISALIAKERNLAGTYLGLLRATARFEMHHKVPCNYNATETSSQNDVDEGSRQAYRGWATFITNSIDAEQLIVERYIPPEQVLHPLLIALAEQREYRLLEQICLS
jgi:DNA polymerase-3 subunit delta'